MQRTMIFFGSLIIMIFTVSNSYSSRNRSLIFKYDNSDSYKGAIYYIHIHKAGGTHFCTIAKKNGYRIMGNRNCGPTIASVKKQSFALQKALELFPRSLSDNSLYIADGVSNSTNPEKENDYIHFCKKRERPDSCNPWSNKIRFDQMRIWTIANGKSYNTYEVEIPIWDYSINDQQDEIFKSWRPGIVANERYISDWARKTLLSRSLKNVFKRRPHPYDKPSRLSTKDSPSDGTEQYTQKEYYCFVTMVRDPVKRAFSHWRMDRRSNLNLPPSLDFDSYLSEYARDNLMTRTLCGNSCSTTNPITPGQYDLALENLKLLDGVLLFEQYELSLKMMDHICPNYGRKESSWSDYVKRTRNVDSITDPVKDLAKRPDLLQKLTDSNAWDIKLYTEAVTIFKNQISLVMKKITGSSVKLQTRFINNYSWLKRVLKNIIGAQDIDYVRVKFPSFFIDNMGNHKVIFNVRNDRICEGYLIVATIDKNTFDITHSVPKNETNYSIMTKQRKIDGMDSGEYLYYNGGIGLLGFPFYRETTATGAEDGRAITSPDGKEAFIVFNCMTGPDHRGMFVIDYNRAPGHAIELTIEGNILQRTEKNWVPFFLPNDDVLHFVYALHPTVILRCEPLKEAVLDRHSTCQCTIIHKEDRKRRRSFSEMIVRGSSPFLEYKWPFYVGLVHTRIRILKHRKKGFLKPCYRTELLVMNMKTFSIIHISLPLQFEGKEYVENLGRTNALDTYNQYGTSIMKHAERWYIGFDIDDTTPLVSEIVNMDTYMNDIINASSRVIQDVHTEASNIPRVRACPMVRMTTTPKWAKYHKHCGEFLESDKLIPLPWSK